MVLKNNAINGPKILRQISITLVVFNKRCEFIPQANSRHLLARESTHFDCLLLAYKEPILYFAISFSNSHDEY